MKFVSTSFAVLLVLHLFICPAVFAGTLSYDTGSKVLSGDSKCTGLSKFDGKDATCKIQDNRIDILLSDTDLTQKGHATTGGENKILTGKLFKTTTRTDGHHQHLTGLVFLTGGSRIDRVPYTTDTVKTTDGNTYSGHLTDITDEHVTINTDDGSKTLDMNHVSTIKSDRLYEITTDVTTANTVAGHDSFSGTASDISFATHKSVTISESVATTETSDSSSHRTVTRKQVLLALLAVVVIGTAVAVPVAVAVGTHHGGHHTAMPTSFFPPGKTTPVANAVTPTSKVADMFKDSGKIVKEDIKPAVRFIF